MQAKRLSIKIKGEKYNFDFSYPEDKRIERNVSNELRCSITLLRKLIDRCGQPVTIETEGRFMDENEIICFSELLKDNSISSLSLNNAGINGKAACALFEKLAKNKRLRNLSLDGNDIDNEAMKSLGRALKTNNTIEAISLSNNPNITSACVRELGNAITAHPSLKQIDISSLTEFDNLFLNQKIHENQHVKKGTSSSAPPQQFSFWKFLSGSKNTSEGIAMSTLSKN